MWAGNWGNGWSHLVPMTHNGDVHMLRYKSTTGLASFAKIKAGGLGIQTLGSASWTKSWTTFSPFCFAGKGHYLAYKTGTGKVARRQAQRGRHRDRPRSGRAGGPSAGPSHFRPRPPRGGRG